VKKNLCRLATITLFMVALSSAALAQSYEHQIRADIPFSFYAGGKLLHAESYTFAINLENRNIAMVPPDKTGSFLPAVPDDGSKSGRPMLTFRTNGGDVYILQKVQWSDFGASFHVKKVLAHLVENQTVNATETIIAQLIK